jgi:hypothetical protein
VALFPLIATNQALNRLWLKWKILACLCVRETALSLAKDGMKVFMTCRSADKGLDAASYIREVLKYFCYLRDLTVFLMISSVGYFNNMMHMWL